MTTIFLHPATIAGGVYLASSTPPAASTPVTVSAAVGGGLARGLTSKIVAATRINAQIAGGLARGLVSKVTTATRINAQIAGGLARGLSTKIIAATRINAQVGNASAAGTHSTVNLTAVVVPPVVIPSIYPPPSSVMAGVTYGPTGVEFVGTFVPPVGGSSGPTAEEIAAAVWTSNLALTVPKFVGLK